MAKSLTRVVALFLILTGQARISAEASNISMRLAACPPESIRVDLFSVQALAAHPVASSKQPGNPTDPAVGIEKDISIAIGYSSALKRELLRSGSFNPIKSVSVKQGALLQTVIDAFKIPLHLAQRLIIRESTLNATLKGNYQIDKPMAVHLDMTLTSYFESNINRDRIRRARRKPRKTNPLSIGRTGNPGRALTLIELPEKDDQDQIERAAEEIVTRNRLFVGLSAQEIESLIEVFEMQYRGLSWRFTGLGSSVRYAVYYDQEQEEVVISPQDDVITFKAYRPEDFGKKESEDPLLKMMKSALIKQASAGISQRDPVNGLKRRYDTIAVELRDHIDRAETVVQRKSRVVTVILPRRVFLAAERDSISDKQAKDLMDWILLSEMGHAFEPGETEDIIETRAFHFFTADRGMNAFLNLHSRKPTSLLNLAEHVAAKGAEAAVACFAFNNPFSQRVVKIFSLFAQNEIDALNISPRAQAARLQVSPSGDRLSYIDLIFEKIWDKIPNRTYMDVDGQPKNRFLSPAA